MKTVSSAALAGADSLIRQYNIDPAMVARLANVDEAALSDPSLLVDAKAVLRFFEIAATSCGERYFGIELAKQQGLEILGSVWLVARHASTLGEAIDNIAEAMQLYSDSVFLRSLPEPLGTAYCYDTIAGDPAGEVQSVELAYILLCQEVRVHAGSSWYPTYVQFRHAKPPSLTRHRKEFGRALQYNQDRNALLVDKKTLALPLKKADRLHGALQGVLRLRQRSVKENFPSRVEIIVRNLISSEICDAATVADALGVSVRTLQHKLAENGTQYQTILDSVRESLARKYLRESELSIAEIAELLQFSETSAFSRFFSKRTSMTPRQYRQASLN